MIFFKVDVSLRTHPKFLKAGREAKGMWLDLMSYTREHELDGRVPKVALSTFDGSAREKLRLVARLLEVGLLRDEGEDYVLHNYAEKGNQTKAEIEKLQKENRDRQTRYRGKARNALVTGPADSVIPISVSVSVSKTPVSEGVQGDPPPGDKNAAWGLEPERESRIQPIEQEITANPEPPAGVTPRHLEYQRAYESGIAGGKGAPYAMPEPQRPELHRAIATFARDRDGKPFRGDTLVRWITHTAKEFASQVRGKEATFYSAFGPRGFMRWLNEAEVDGGEANHG